MSSIVFHYDPFIHHVFIKHSRLQVINVFLPYWIILFNVVLQDSSVVDIQVGKRVEVLNVADGALRARPVHHIQFKLANEMNSGMRGLASWQVRFAKELDVEFGRRFRQAKRS